MLELKIYPDSCLRSKTNPVENFQKDLPEVIRAMADIMYINNGIGLATTQVGLKESFLVVDIGGGLMSFVNPEILENSEKKTRMEEGCLSLPGVAVSVTRAKQIKIKAQDEKGEVFVKEFSGLLAAVIQHEMDHLKGKLLIDYMNPVKHIIAVTKLAGDKRKRVKA